MSHSSDSRISPRPGLFESIPAAAKATIICGIHAHATAEIIRAELAAFGILRSPRTIMTWMREVRIWLGLAGYYPSSTACRKAVDLSAAANGNPTAEDIHAGWSPAELSVIS